MGWTYWLCIALVALVLWLAWRARRGAGYHGAARRRRRRGEKPVMEEIILKLLDKGVQVTTINGTQTGKLTHYSQGWLTLTSAKGKEQYINADYIITLNEVPIRY